MEDSTTLTHLHEKMLKTLETNQMKLFDYLLNCQGFLKNTDLKGWTQTFAPEMLTEKKQNKKKMRCSPANRVFQKLPNCIECKSGEVIYDAREGSVVCTACGLVQSTQASVGENVGTASMSVDQMMNTNRNYVHHYSRVVYFRSFLVCIQGQSSPDMSPETYSQFEEAAKEYKKIDVAVVIKILKRLDLAKKYRRHRYRLAVLLSGGDYKPVQIPGAVFMQLLTLFRRVEVYWDHGCKSNLKTRRVFLSYPYVFYQLCYHMKCMELTGRHHLLKSKLLQGRLHLCYGRLAKKAKLNCNLDVFY